MVTLVAFTALGLLCPPRSALAWESLAPGVEYEAKTNPGPVNIRTLRIDLCEAGVRMRATAPAEAGKVTSAWASNVGVVAAINGGFFSSPTTLGGGFGWGNGQLWNSSDDAGRGQIAFGPNQVELIESQVVLNTAPDWVEEGVSGDATLVRDGAPVYGHGGLCPTRQPRTVAGFSEDRTTLILIAVDGRGAGGSIGLTCNGLSDLLVSYGAHHAINLDGGGSTTMWVQGKGVVNNPSDGSQRVVANHLGVYASGEGPPRNCMAREVLGVLAGNKRHVKSAQDFNAWKFNLLDVLAVSDELLDMYGETSPWPSTPELVRPVGGTAISIIDGGIRRHVPSPYAMKTWRLGGVGLEERPPADVEAMPEGGPLTSSPVLIKGSGPEIYVLDHPPPYRAVTREAMGPDSLDNNAVGKVSVTVLNAGYNTWSPGEVVLRRVDDRVNDSELCTESWDDCRTPFVLDSEVNYFEELTLEFDVQAWRNGSISECFTFATRNPPEVVSWFSDAPNGGPLADEICVTLEASGVTRTPDVPTTSEGRRFKGGVTGSCAIGQVQVSKSPFAVLALLLMFRRRRARRAHCAHGRVIASAS